MCNKPCNWEILLSRICSHFRKSKIAETRVIHFVASLESDSLLPARFPRYITIVDIVNNASALASQD